MNKSESSGSGLFLTKSWKSLIHCTTHHNFAGNSTKFLIVANMLENRAGEHFDYCSVVWGNCNKSLSIKLQKLQNRAARILTSSSYDANADDLFVKLGWQKLNLQRDLKTATMVYKSLNGLAPDYLKSMFTNRSAISTYSLRNCEGKLAVPLPRTNFLKNSFSYNGALLWNSLPINLRQAQSLASFKTGCRGFLFENAS